MGKVAKVRILFCGTPDVAVPSLEVLAASGHDVVGVLTRPDAPVGRSKRPVPSPVASRASQLGLEVLKPQKLSDPDFRARFTQLAPQLCLVVAYGALIPQSLLDEPRHGWVNLHFSLLPRWRGAAPVQWAIRSGDTQTGACTFQIEKTLDSGPIYRTLTRDLTPGDTAGEVLTELAHLGANLLLDTIDDIAAGIDPQPQSFDGVTLAPKITTDDARIDFDMTSVELVNHIGAMSPDPGAWTLLNGQRFKIYRALVTDDVVDLPDLAPGEMDYSKKKVWVGVGDGVVELDEVQAFSKKRMKAIDWVRGANPGRCRFGE